MKLHLQRLALASALAFASAGAFASHLPISLGNNPSVSPLVGYGSNNGVVTLSYSFSLDSATDFSKLWGELRPTDAATFELTLTGPNGTSVLTSLGAPSSPYAFEWASLADGAYLLDIVATPTLPTSFTAYGGFLASAPAVPEPETYALAIAGLGIVGTLARRRKQRAV